MSRRTMSHEEAFTVLDAVALDAIEGADRDAVLAHAEGCEICRRELSQLRDTAAFLAFSSPLGADTAAGSRGKIHSRLMARAAAEAGEDYPKTSAHQQAPDARGVVSMLAWRRAEWVAVAAGVLLVVSVSLLASSLRKQDRLEDALRAETANAERVRSELMSRDSLIAGLTGKDVAMMTLTSAGTKAPFAHMFWDKAHNTWTLVAHDMPALKPGRTYQLWLVTPTAKISAGTFEPKNGEGMVRATYALDPKQLMAIAITEEPAGGMPQPTGAPVLAVQAQ